MEKQDLRKVFVIFKPETHHPDHIGLDLLLYNPKIGKVHQHVQLKKHL